MRPWVLGAAAVLATVLLVVVAVGARDEPGQEDVRAVAVQPVAGVLTDAPPPVGPETAGTASAAAGEEAVTPIRRLGAVILRRTQLRRSPSLDGQVVTTLGRRTGFGSRQQLAVVARKGDWLGVLHQSVSGGKAGWIPASAARLEQRPYEIVVNRAKLRATVLHDGNVVMQFKVGVGRADHKTPAGRYAVTDSLEGFGPYGCCILAITARQKNLPQGWSGGDRVAFHGGPSWRVGIRTTTGCMTVRDATLRKLMKRIHLGTRVTVRA